MKIFIKSFGCQINEYDSFRIFDLLKRCFDCTIVNIIENADVYIINTCSIRKKVEEKIILHLQEVYKIKQYKNKNLLIVASGCLSSNVYLKEFIDIFIKPRNLTALPNLLVTYFKKKKIDYIFVNKRKSLHLTMSCNDYFPKINYTGNIVYIPISDGCSNYCSYCSVPYTRGTEHCRESKFILQDVAYYVTNGIKEIILLGHNVNSYKDNKKNISFHTLVQKIASMENVHRIRFLSAHPKDFSYTFIDLYESIEKLANHVHLPLQSASNKILKRMKRGYTVEEFKEIVYRLKKNRPDITITTDVIVGFPGETNDDFLKTVECLKELSFDSSYCFLYSSRVNTISYSYKNDVDENMKLKRLSIVQQLIMYNVKKNTEKMIKSKQRVLVCGFINNNIYWGKADNNRTVIVESNRNIVGEFIMTKVLSNIGNTLIVKNT